VGRFVVLLVVVAGLAGGGAWLATQPAADVQPIQPSSAAVIAAEARIFASFKAAEVKAVLTRAPQTVQVRLSDVELTSLVASRLAQSSTTLHDPVLRGGTDDAFHATTDVDWNGVTFHIGAAITVTFDSAGTIAVHVRDASVGRLPVPGSIGDALVAQSQSASTVQLPPGISDVALQPVDGGAVLTATASPSLAGLAG